MHPTSRAIALVLSVVLATPALGDAFVPDQFPSIQAAIDSTLSGATIRVRPGRYFGRVDFKGKAITIVSDEGPLRTTIDGDVQLPPGPVVRCNNGEGLDSVLDGFTVTGGSGENSFVLLGGGFFIFQASLTVRNCVITGNTAQFGAGAYVQLGDPHFTDCVFRGNTAENAGGGFYETIAGSVLTNCSFVSNSVLEHTGVGGGFLTDTNTSPVLTNCTFWGNTAPEGGGAIHDEDGQATVWNSIIWDNTAPNIFGNPAIGFSNVQGGWPGTGNIASDPNFAHDGALFMRLARTSPCIDAADDTTSNLALLDPEGFDRVIDGDADGTAHVDMGAFEFNPRVLNVTADLWYGGLQEAIDDSASGDEIVAGAGVYRELIDFDGRAIALRSATGRDDTVIDSSGIGTPVVRCDEDEGRDTVLDGFTVTGASTGMWIFGSSPMVVSCRFAESDGLAGLSMDTASPVISDCEFIDNVGGFGGGMLIDDGGSPVISNCAFRGNVANLGAGVAVTEGTMATFTGCTFDENFAASDGGSAYIRNTEPVFEQCVFADGGADLNGGGVACLGTGGGTLQPRFVDCDFSGNNANTGGGLSTIGMDPVVTNCSFLANGAGDGGAVAVVDGQPQLVACDFDQNLALSEGGAVFNIAGADTIIADCTFTLNTAVLGGAVLNDTDGRSRVSRSSFVGNNANLGGAVMNNNDSGTTLKDCNFHQNLARDGGAMFNEGGFSRPEVTRCTFTANSADSGGAVYNLGVDRVAITSCVFGANSASPIPHSEPEKKSGPAVHRRGRCRFR